MIDKNTTTGYENMMFQSFGSMLSYNFCIIQICCGLYIAYLKLVFGSNSLYLIYCGMILLCGVLSLMLIFPWQSCRLNFKSRFIGYGICNVLSIVAVVFLYFDQMPPRIIFSIPFRVRKYEDSLPLLVIILSVQVLLNLFTVVLPTCFKFKKLEENQAGTNNRINQKVSGTVKFVHSLMRERVVGVSESKLSSVCKKFGKFTLHDFIRFQIVNMLPLFGSYLLIQYTFPYVNFHYDDAAKVIGLIIFVQTMTFLSMILTSIWNLFCDEDSYDNQKCEEKNFLEFNQREVPKTLGDINENFFQDCK